MNTNTTTATAPAAAQIDATTTTTTLARTQSALDRLTKSAAKSSLDDLVRGKTRRSLLLVDCSGSMDSWVSSANERRIDALRKIVRDLRETHPVPVAAFGGGGVVLVDSVPEPNGGTPMSLAIEYAHREGANHAVVVTDGQPDSQRATLDAAVRFGHPVDVFYVGDVRTGGREDEGVIFARELARITGGTAHIGSFSQPKALTTAIIGLLGDGGAL